MHLKFAVIIATCNRCESLRDTLDSLLKQDCGWDAVAEIIIVDNNSTDSTGQLVQSYEHLFKTKLRYLKEGKQGKSHALNLGIAAAQSDILAFTDDDVILDANWLSEIINFFKSNDVDVLGGRTLPLYPAGIPEWIKKNQYYLRGPIVSYDQGEGIVDYKSGKISPFIGANVVYNKNVFAEAGLYDVELGPGKGTFGDDVEMFERVRQTGKRIFYNGKVLAWHKVEKDRVNLKYIARWNFQNGKFTALIENRGPGVKFSFICGVPCYLIRGAFLKTVKLLFSLFWPKLLLKNWCALFFNFGMICGYREWSRKSFSVNRGQM